MASVMKTRTRLIQQFRSRQWSPWVQIPTSSDTCILCLLGVLVCVAPRPAWAHRQMERKHGVTSLKETTRKGIDDNPRLRTPSSTMDEIKDQSSHRNSSPLVSTGTDLSRTGNENQSPAQILQDAQVFPLNYPSYRARLLRKMRENQVDEDSHAKRDQVALRIFPPPQIGGGDRVYSGDAQIGAVIAIASEEVGQIDIKLTISATGHDDIEFYLYRREETDDLTQFIVLPPIRDLIKGIDSKFVQLTLDAVGIPSDNSASIVLSRDGSSFRIGDHSEHGEILTLDGEKGELEVDLSSIETDPVPAGFPELSSVLERSGSTSNAQFGFNRNSIAQMQSRSAVGVYPCFVHKAKYNDNDGDIWTESGWFYRNARYHLVDVYHNGKRKRSTYLDSSGCLEGGANYGSGEYEFKVWSKAKLGNLTLKAKRRDYYSVRSSKFRVDGGHEVRVIKFKGDNSRFNALLPAVQSVLHTHQHLGRETININVEVEQSHSSFSCRKRTMNIREGREHRMFTVAHEMGHAFACLVNEESIRKKLTSLDCSYYSASCPDGSQDDDTVDLGDAHALTSKEWVDCSIGEGWASFYAATIWNYNQYDCSYGSVDCEGEGTYKDAYLENYCEGKQGIAGQGTDIDWLKQFWDMYSMDGGLSVMDMVNLFEESDEWTRSDGYEKLNDAAQRLGGRWEDAWDSFDSMNGIDH